MRSRWIALTGRPSAAALSHRESAVVIGEDEAFRDGVEAVRARQAMRERP